MAINSSYMISSRDNSNEISVGITEENYQELKAAVLGMRAACSIEEKFAYVMGNYFDLEREANEQALLGWEKAQLQYEERIEGLHELNRRIANLLSTCRMYIHQSEGTLSAYDKLAKKSYSEKFKEFTSEQYDSSFSYRLLEEVRNYTQHRDLPSKAIHILLGGILDDSPSPAKIIATWYELDVEAMIADKRCKKKLISELKTVAMQKSGGKINLRHEMKEYVACLNRINEKVRKEFDLMVDGWKSLIMSSLDKPEFEFCKQHGLLLMSNDDDDRILLNLCAFERRERLIKLYADAKYVFTTTVVSSCIGTLKRKGE